MGELYICLKRISMFFSNRRRHTTFDCDWSSDVCSSDLLCQPAMDHQELEMERIGSAARYPNHYQRRRVRIIEGWHRTPENVSRISGGMFGGELYDRFSRDRKSVV